MHQIESYVFYKTGYTKKIIQTLEFKAHLVLLVLANIVCLF